MLSVLTTQSLIVQGKDFWPLHLRESLMADLLEVTDLPEVAETSAVLKIVTSGIYVDNCKQILKNNS